MYLWDLDHGFAGVILIKKTGDTTPTGSWDSIHVFECKEKTRSASYKLTTTVMMWLQTNNQVSLVPIYFLQTVSILDRYSEFFKYINRRARYSKK